MKFGVVVNLCESLNLYVNWFVSIPRSQIHCNHSTTVEAAMPLCLRYLDGCKYLSLPGRWDPWKEITKSGMELLSGNVYVFFGFVFCL